MSDVPQETVIAALFRFVSGGGSIVCVVLGDKRSMRDEVLNGKTRRWCLAATAFPLISHSAKVFQPLISNIGKVFHP